MALVVAMTATFAVDAYGRQHWGGPDLVLGASALKSWPASLPRARDFNGVPAPKLGTVIGAGHLRGEGADDALTYGAFLYDYDADIGLFVLYAIGRQDGQAVLRGMWANHNC